MYDFSKVKGIPLPFAPQYKETLSFTTFADHFALTDKQYAYNRYSRILKKYVNYKDLEENFKLWRKSDFAEDYWTKKIHSSTVKKSRRKAALITQKSVLDEFSQLDKYLERESTLSATTTDESDYNESEQTFAYRLTFDELNDNSLKSSALKYKLYKKKTTFEKRMGLSSITFPPADKVPNLKRHSLSDDCYLMVRRFKMAVEETKPSIPANYSQPSDSFWPLLYTYNNQQIVQTSEPDFIAKHVTNFLQNIMFAYQDDLLFRWDVASRAYNESNKKKRPDFVVCTSDGFEVGCGEIKPPNANTKEKEEDRCRVPEHLKKQLHMRLQVASEEKELVTFGFLILGEDLELSMMEFKEGKYEYSVVKQLKLPTMFATFERMDESLKYLLGFFDLIKSTVVEKNNSSNASLFLKYKGLLKPTISFE